jgi:hypothetical protein
VASRAYRQGETIGRDGSEQIIPDQANAVKTCVICGAAFRYYEALGLKRWATRICCSHRCVTQYRWRDHVKLKSTKTCKRCGQCLPNRHYKNYCSRSCRRTPQIACKHCGKLFHRGSDADKKFCSRMCASHSTPAEGGRFVEPVCKVCEQCGNDFLYKPNNDSLGRFCSPSCAGLFNVRHSVAPDMKSAEFRNMQLEGLKRSPLSGSFITHCRSRWWYLRDPRRRTYSAKNLSVFIRNHRALFTLDELQMCGRTTLAYAGLSKLRPSLTKRKQVTTWHGWSWWLEGETESEPDSFSERCVCYTTATK